MGIVIVIANVSTLSKHVSDLERIAAHADSIFPPIHACMVTNTSNMGSLNPMPPICMIPANLASST